MSTTNPRFCEIIDAINADASDSRDAIAETPAPRGERGAVFEGDLGWRRPRGISFAFSAILAAQHRLPAGPQLRSVAGRISVVIKEIRALERELTKSGDIPVWTGIPKACAK